MSTTRVVSTAQPDGNVQCVLTVPFQVLDRVNNAERTFGEQEGAAMRDRLLEALAAMVIASLDEFRMGPIFQSASQDRRIDEERAQQKRITPEQAGELGGDDAPLDFGDRVR